MVLTPNENPQDELLFKNVADLATVWKIERTDGTRYYFTNHDRDIEFEGNVYSPAIAGNASSIRKESGLKDANREYAGIIDSDTITTEDLAAGRFNGARMVESIISWKYPWAGPILVTVGWMTQPTYDDEQWKVEVEGLTRFLRDLKGRVYSETCDYNLGDSKCRKDISDDIVYDATIASLNTRSTGVTNREIFNANSSGVGGKVLSTTDDFYKFGRIIWSTGNNIGVISQVKTYTGTTKTIEIEDSLPADPQVGDEFVLEVGCDKLYTTCRTKFNNLMNFGGFPYIPGVYYMLQQPVKQ